MAAQKDSDRSAATNTNITTAAYWVIVDAAGASVKMTLAQIKTFYNAVTSITGDVTAAVVAGVATTTIGALTIATSMIQALAVTTAKIADQAVTYAKIQNMTTARLLGRTTAASGVIEEISVNSTYLDLTAGVLSLSGTSISGLAAPTVLAADTAGISSTTLADAGINLAVVANTRYFFEFYALWTAAATTNIRLSVSVPASPSALATWVEYKPDSTLGTGTIQSEVFNVSDGGGGSTVNVDNTNNIHCAHIRGVLRNGSNAGNIKLRVAVTAFTAGEIILKHGSFGRLQVL